MLVVDNIQMRSFRYVDLQNDVDWIQHIVQQWRLVKLYTGVIHTKHDIN